MGTQTDQNSSSGMDYFLWEDDAAHKSRLSCPDGKLRLEEIDYWGNLT